MRSSFALGVVAFTFTELVAPGLADAAIANCVGPSGTCEVSNDGFDWAECMCADGSGGGGGGGNEWAGYTPELLDAVCELQLASLCGPAVPPPGGLPCSSALGDCVIDNDPIDQIYCACAAGWEVLWGGGMSWAGYTDPELLAECEVQLDLYCAPPPPPPPPPPGIPCSSVNGDCLIANVPEDYLECTCADGSGFGFGGGNTWAGYTDPELLNECTMQLDAFCGPPPPPPPPPPVPLECSSRLGSCQIANQPIDFLECSCAEGEDFSGGGGMEWAGLSDEELLAMCDEVLADGCAVEEPTGTTTDDPGETETGGGATTGDAESSGGGGGLDTSGGGEGGSTGTTPDEGTTSGGGATSGGTDGGGGAVDGGSGGGCSVGTAPTTSWALALLGMLGLRLRRRFRGRPGHRGRAA